MGRTNSFLYVSGTFTTIDISGVFDTEIHDINNAGKFVGTLADATGFHGLLYDIGGTFTTIDVPGARATFLDNINDNGQIIGIFDDSEDRRHNFLYSGGTFTTIEVPGAVSTFLGGINNAGQIVGAFENSTGLHGFLATPTVPEPGSLAIFGVGLLGFVIARRQSI